MFYLCSFVKHALNLDQNTIVLVTFTGRMRRIPKGAAGGVGGAKTAAGGVCMRVATWNINGVRARIETASAWLERSRPDIVCFQEIKCIDEAFPAEAFERLGYNVALHGQKGFNGVALLSLLPLDEVRRVRENGQVQDLLPVPEPGHKAR